MVDGPDGCGSGTYAHAAAHSSRVSVTLTYLGTAGWEITDGTIVILVDPYFSRIPLLPDRSILARAEAADRRPSDPNTIVISDTAAVDARAAR